MIKTVGKRHTKLQTLTDKTVYYCRPSHRSVSASLNTDVPGYKLSKYNSKTSVKAILK